MNHIVNGIFPKVINLKPDNSKVFMDNVVKPNRNDLFSPLQQIFDNFYEDFFADISPNGIKSRSQFPRWDIYEKNSNWIIEMAINGCEPEDINVEIIPEPVNNFGISSGKRILKVSGRVSEENRLNESVGYLVRELRRSAFERSVYLPDNIEGEPEATMKNGLLKLSWKLPEKSKEPQQKRIEIKKMDGT